MSDTKTAAVVEPVPGEEEAAALKGELLAAYPPKIGRKRERQIIVNKRGEDGSYPEIQANTRTLPGIITQRGCTYAGCKGVVVGPTRDILQITHGPIGCGFYSWLTRRNQTRAEGASDDNFMPYSLSTDLEDKDIVFGGEKKLRRAVKEAYDTFRPKAIAIFSTCPVGLIGDDVHAVARDMTEELGITVFGMSCEGYKGVSQSAGHHIANNAVFTHVVGRNPERPEGEFKVNMLGEYNIGGDAFELERLLEILRRDLGHHLLGQLHVRVDGPGAPIADVNLRDVPQVDQLYGRDDGDKVRPAPGSRSISSGRGPSSKSLRHLAEYFADAALAARVEVVDRVGDDRGKEGARPTFRPRLEGKRECSCTSAAAGRTIIRTCSAEIGMEAVSAGYEFAHRDDYEGRNVLPSIKVDADSRNIEELLLKRRARSRKMPRANDGRDVETAAKSQGFPLRNTGA